MTTDQSPECVGGLEPSRGQVQAGGMTFSYLEWGGSGAPLLLLHGITSSARGWWRVAPELVALGYHVYALDMPGHGQSQLIDVHRIDQIADRIASGDRCVTARQAGCNRPFLGWRSGAGTGGFDCRGACCAGRSAAGAIERKGCASASQPISKDWACRLKKRSLPSAPQTPTGTPAISSGKARRSSNAVPTLYAACSSAVAIGI